MLTELNIKRTSFSKYGAEFKNNRNNSLRISGGTLTVKTNTGKGMKSGEELIIDDGYIDIESLQNEGIESKGTFVITGGILIAGSSEE